MQSAKDFINALVAAHFNDPLGQDYQEIASLFDKKLWHQLTVKLETFVRNPIFISGNGLTEVVDLYHKFIKELYTKFNLLKYTKIAIVVSHNLANNNEGKSAFNLLKQLLDGVNAEKEKEVYCLLQSEIAFLSLFHFKQVEESKSIADKVGQILETLSGADPFVFSSYYRFLSHYFKHQVLPTEFYKNTLMYLVYTPLEQISIEDQRIIAFDLGMTALVSPDIFNFGELLAHPILNSLKNTPQQWLVDFLFAFNTGQIEKFNADLERYSNNINNQQIIKTNFSLLKEKISILALMELVFTKPSEERTIPFEVIAQTTHLPFDHVEILVMKAMSLNLVKGVIDGVNNTVTLSWVQPRVLDLNQIGKMQETLQRWSDRVKNVLSLMQTETGPDFFV
jgi:26S proteasome regulatory subunit N9